MDKPTGVYVHVPFCSRRCDYCAFATWTDRAQLMDAYAAACRVEMSRACLSPAATVFFGGGTPSLLPADLLTSILDEVPRRPDAEVTVECNPENVTPALPAAYRAAGVTRLSFGMQSTAPHVLRALGRQHDAESVRSAVAAALDAGLETWNVDLIFGAVGESADDWRRTLDDVLALGPPHVSAYALTVEPGTPLALDATRHPDDDDQAEKYLLAESALTAAGLRNYEVSNWARPGHECRHNLLYWQQGDYRGIGCAAHSHAAGRRWWNVHAGAVHRRSRVRGVHDGGGGDVGRGRPRSRSVAAGVPHACRRTSGCARRFRRDARRADRACRYSGSRPPHPERPLPVG